MVESSYLAVIKVVGAGGGGTNAVSRMVDAGLKGVEFIAINTDVQALQSCEADIKLAAGHNLTHGLGAGRQPRRRRRRRRGVARRHQGGAEGRRHGLRHRRRGRRHRHRRRPGDRRDRQGGDRRAHRRRGHEAVRVRGQPPHAAGARRDRQAARQGRHPDHRPEPEAARGRRAPDLRPGGVPDGRRHPAPGRPGDHRPDHHAGPDQPRLRRRAHGDGRRRLGDDGHRDRRGREPRPGGGEDGGQLAR